jgi:hypothetical protein
MRTRETLLIVGAIVTAAAFAGGSGFALGAGGGGPVATPPPQTQEQQHAAATKEAEAARGQQAQAIQAASIAPVRSETVFVPVAPCRIVDTRAGTGTNRTRFAPNATRSYVVAGTTGFPAQGGKSGGCGIPASATGIAASVIAVNPSAKGAFRAWAAGSAAPTANVLNYGTITASSGATVGVRPGGGSGLSVKNLDGRTDLVVDVTGYYAPQMHGLIGPSGLYAGSSRIISSTSTGVGTYQVVFDQDVSYCTPMVDAYNAGPGVYAAAYAFSGNTATVFTWYLNSTTHVEVPYSFYVYISVVC